VSVALSFSVLALFQLALVHGLSERFYGRMSAAYPFLGELGAKPSLVSLYSELEDMACRRSDAAFRYYEIVCEE
jgi:hypothetical protein